MNCQLCDVELTDDPYVLPLYEGRYKPSSDFHAPVCPVCFCKHRIPGFFRPKLGKPVETIRRLSPFIGFKRKAEWAWEYACWIFMESKQEFRILSTTSRGACHIMQITPRNCGIDGRHFPFEIWMRPYGLHGATSVKRVDASVSPVESPDFDGHRLERFIREHEGWELGRRHQDQDDMVSDKLFKVAIKQLKREEREQKAVGELLESIMLYWSF